VHILGIVDAWRNAGHEVHIVSPPGVTPDSPVGKSSYSPDKRTFWKNRARHIPEIFFEFLEIAYNFWSYIALSKRIRAQSFELVFERYSFFCIAGLLASKRYSLPFFLEVNYTSHTPIVRKRTHLLKGLQCWIESILFKRADSIIVVSSYLKKHLISMGVKEHRILVLPNAADPGKFHPSLKADHLRKQLKLQQRKVVGFVGYFYPWHGIDLLLETFPYVRQQVGRVYYLLVGDGPLYDGISQMIRQKTMEENVRLMGSVPHDMVPEYLALFDVAVMPHSNDYGSPMKILEYMAMGKTVIAPRVGPILDIIEDGKTGLLFDPGHSRQLAHVISKALKEHELRDKIGKAARLSILERHNWNTNSQQILHFYNDFISPLKLTN